MSDSTIRQPFQEQSQTIRPQAVPQIRRREVYVALHMLGADGYDLLLPETHHLAQLLREGEVITGVVYGKYIKETIPYTGRGLLAITNLRILLLDKKPLFLQFDDISFNMVSGVQYRSTLGIETVILNTRMGDVAMRTINNSCAQRFVQTVEDMLMARDRGW